MPSDSNWIHDMMEGATAPEEALAHIDAYIQEMESKLVILKALRRALAPSVRSSKPDDRVSIHKPPVDNEEDDRPNIVKLQPGNRGKAEITKTKLRDIIAAAIMSGGPMESGKLRAITKASDAYFYEVMKGPWFERQADGWHLTNEAFAALRDGKPTKVQPDNEED